MHYFGKPKMTLSLKKNYIVLITSVVYFPEHEGTSPGLQSSNFHAALCLPPIPEIKQFPDIEQSNSL